MRKVFISVLVAVLLIPVIVTYSGCQTPTTEPTEEELARLENQISTLREELSANQETVNKLQGELDEKTTEINKLLADIAEKSTRIEKLEAELAELQQPEESEVSPQVVGVEYYHSKGWRITFEDFAEDQGWKLAQIDVPTLTHEYLEKQGISILYIPDVKIAYTENEIDVIVEFVENGGGLLLIAPEYRALTDEISKRFGVRIDLDFLGKDRTITVQPYHPLAKDVGTLQLDPSMSFLTISPPAYDVLQPPIRVLYRPVIAAGEFGAGRFIVFSYFFDLNAADNSSFLRNVLYWLEQVNLP